MRTIVICGWVRCGNRWLARLLTYYADEGTDLDSQELFARDYWNAQGRIHYFGQETAIRISHVPACGFWEDDAWTCKTSQAEDTYLIHIWRDPRDAFVSWFHLLMQGSNGLPPGKQNWKGYLSWLIGQQMYPFRPYGESWLALREINPPNVTWITHERMRENRAAGLLSLMDEMGLPLDRGRAQYAARILEREPYRAAYRRRDAKSERGLPGEWKTHFDARDARLIERHYGDLIVRLGYGGDPDWERLLERTTSV